MKSRPITPHALDELYCDEFRRDAKYANWRPHGSDDWLVIYTEAGSGRIVGPTGSCTTRPGDALLYAPTELQDYGTAPEPGKWHLLWSHFTPKPHWRLWLRWPLNESGLRLLHLEEGEVREQFRASMFSLISLRRRELPGALDLAFNALESTLLWANVAASSETWLSKDARVREAVDYLIAHLREPFSLENLALYCGLSVSRLACLFKQQTGTSPQRFLEHHRLKHASQLLRLTSLTISEVAAEVGYGDPFYFTNRFRRSNGKSPTQFRNENRRAPV